MGSKTEIVYSVVFASELLELELPRAPHRDYRARRDDVLFAPPRALPKWTVPVYPGCLACTVPTQLTPRMRQIGLLKPFSVRLEITHVLLNGRLNLGLQLTKEPPGIKWVLG